MCLSFNVKCRGFISDKEVIAYTHVAMADSKARVQCEKVAKKVGRQPFRVSVSDFFQGKNLLKKQ